MCSCWAPLFGLVRGAMEQIMLSQTWVVCSFVDTTVRRCGAFGVYGGASFLICI